MFQKTFVYLQNFGKFKAKLSKGKENKIRLKNIPSGAE